MLSIIKLHCRRSFISVLYWNGLKKWMCLIKEHVLDLRFSKFCFSLFWRAPLFFWQSNLGLHQDDKGLIIFPSSLSSLFFAMLSGRHIHSFCVAIKCTWGSQKQKEIDLLSLWHLLGKEFQTEKTSSDSNILNHQCVACNDGLIVKAYPTI